MAFSVLESLFSCPAHWLSAMLHLQRASVLDALRQPNFSGSLRNSLAAQGACTCPFVPIPPTTGPDSALVLACLSAPSWKKIIYHI